MLTQYIIDNKTSFSYVSYFILLLVKVCEVYAIDRFLFISPCDKIFPTAIPEASIVNIKGFEKSGHCKTESLHNFYFNVSNDHS